MKQSLLDRAQLWLWKHRRRSGPVASGQVVVDYAMALLRDLVEGQVSLWATGLAYTMLLALVPLLALAFALLKALGVSNALYQTLEKLMAPLGPDSSVLAARLAGFVAHVRVGVLGSLGACLLLYWAVALIYKLEMSFNHLWEVERGRPWSRRIGEYVAVFVIGPTFIFTALAMTASLRNPQVVGSILEIEPFGSLLVWLSKALPYVLMIAMFTFLYAYIPNVRVKTRAALIGGLCAGLAWQTASVAFAAFVAHASNYNAIYSGFAIFIFLLLWMYVGWIILLLGCRLAFYVQHAERLIPSGAPSYASREGEAVALTAVSIICRAFREGVPAPTLHDLARRLTIPEARLQQLLARLVSEGSLAQRVTTGGYLPGQDLDRLKVATVWLQARGRLPDPPRGNEAAAAFVSRLEAAARLDMTTVRQWLDTS